MLPRQRGQLFALVALGGAAGLPTCPAMLPFDWVQSGLAFPHKEATTMWSFVRVFPKQKMVLCTVPGAGSTPVRTLINAMAAALSGGAFNISSTMIPHEEMRKAWWLHPLEMMPTHEVRPWARAVRAPATGSTAPLPLLAQVERIACDPTWTKVAFVRNPYIRLLSKFQVRMRRKMNLRFQSCT